MAKNKDRQDEALETPDMVGEPSLTVLNLPPADLAIKKDPDGQTRIFDCCRGKWLVLTPEEWVRQRFVDMLHNKLGYPYGRIGNEIGLRFNGMVRRCDTVIYDRAMRPSMIVEYKAPYITITQATFDQIARYNMVLGVRFLVVSNGLHHFCCEMTETGGYRFRRNLPLWNEVDTSDYTV